MHPTEHCVFIYRGALHRNCIIYVLIYVSICKGTEKQVMPQCTRIAPLRVVSIFMHCRSLGPSQILLLYKLLRNITMYTLCTTSGVTPYFRC